MKEKIIKGKDLHPDMVVKRFIGGIAGSIEILVSGSAYDKNPIYFEEDFLVVRDPKDKLQQAIQDAIREERERIIASLDKLKKIGIATNMEVGVYNSGITKAQRYIRALNEREG